MPTRPVAQQFTYTTSTGQFVAYYGTGMSVGAIQYNNTSTQKPTGTVDYSLGGSDVWVTLITLTATSTGSRSYAAASTAVFDRLRVDVTANTLSDTGSSGYPFWLGAR